MADLNVDTKSDAISVRSRYTPSIVVDDVHVTYEIYEDRSPRLRELMANRFHPRPTRRVRALRGVSFEMHPGDALGVIGRNGSGKSTLLRTMAGLLPPTAGTVYAQSYPVLLGVSAVMQPDLSGRRNIILGGTALGIPRSEIKERAEEIAEFAGLTDFIDMPMRAYSSGMAARLQFSIATCVTPAVLLIDEALAVGDEEFKRRSRERLIELLGDAGTVVLVSHSLGSIEEFCTRVIWLDKGVVVEDGAPDDVIEAYLESTSRPE